MTLQEPALGNWRGRPTPALYSDQVVFYGVVSFETEKVVQFFPTREEAEAMIAGVLEDAPELAEALEVVPVEFSTEPN